MGLVAISVGNISTFVPEDPDCECITGNEDCCEPCECITGNEDCCEPCECITGNEDCCEQPCRCITGDEVCCEPRCCNEGIGECCRNPGLATCEEIMDQIVQILESSENGVSPSQTFTYQLQLLDRGFMYSDHWHLIPERYRECYQQMSTMINNMQTDANNQSLLAINAAYKSLGQARKLRTEQKEVIRLIYSKYKELSQELVTLGQDLPANETLIGDKLVALNQIAIDYNALMAQFNLEKEAAIDEAEYQISSISDEREIVQDYKSILEVEAEVLELGLNAIDDSRLDILNTLANKCPVIIGRPVYVARILLYRLKAGPAPDVYPDTCDDLGLRQVGNQSSDNLLKVYPNPSSSTIFLSTDKAMTNLDVKIYSMSGLNIIQASDISIDKSAPLELNNLNPGVYMLSIESENYSQKSKFVIID